MSKVNNLPLQLKGFRLCWSRLRQCFRECFNRLANRLGVPGGIQSMEINDDVSCQRLVIKVGLFFTCISINGRDYFFNRFSGKFDGTGSGCGCDFSYQPDKSACCRLASTPESVSGRQACG